MLCSRFKIYDLQFISDEQQHRINIQGPEIGSWFAVAFISWTDPNNERIEQQGITLQNALFVNLNSTVHLH